MRKLIPFLLSALCAVLSWGDSPLRAQAPAAGASTNSAPFEIREGDRIALIGDTLIEREREYGYLETRWHTRYFDRHFIVRNLGWSADTPAGISRASFDFKDPSKGFEKLKEQLQVIKPTLVVLGYGMASSFDGAQGLEKFKGEMNKLIDTIREISGPDVRFLFLGPIRHEPLLPPMPSPVAHNVQLKLYNDAIGKIASERQAWFVSLYDSLPVGTIRHTDDGIHLSEFGYWRLTEVIEKQLGIPALTWLISFAPDGSLREKNNGIRVNGLSYATNAIRFEGVEDFLPNPVLMEGTNYLAGMTAAPRIQVTSLPPGSYELRVDGRVVDIAPETEWSDGRKLFRGPQLTQAELLRQAVLRKNELFFNRWRPENETYLFGFRKHEQGQNGREIPMFDPLIQEQEELIARLRQPKAHKFELLPSNYSGMPKMPKAPARTVEALPGTNGPSPSFELAEGFEINLFAENPLLAKPIQMNFDSRGRLWVASSSVYPQIEPGQKADDKIILLEDTQGVGRADRATVFADGLLIPTGVEPGNDGVYVGQSTELLHFKDTDGDGRADQKRVVLSGFGTEDTHHIVHTLRWGNEGMLYFDQSIYIHSHLETPHGVVRLNSGGVLQLRPGEMQLGVYLRGFCNPWGHVFDEFGQSFVTDGAGFQGISYGIPGATYFTYADMRREMKSVSPGNYPKFAGLEVIYSSNFPADWQGNLITCDFRAHRIVRFALTEQGAGYVTREMPDLVRSTNVAFRPIDVKLGPDGALYVADWSNPIIQHGEVDFRDPRRDHEHGRIWRITAKGRPLASRVNYSGLLGQQIMSELLGPNLQNQKQVRRLLIERGLALEVDLRRWVNFKPTDRKNLEALWLFQGIGLVETNLLKKVLAAEDGRIRAAGIRVLSYWHDRVPDAAQLLEKMVQDEHPRARLEAVRALALIPNAQSAALVLGVLNKPMDEFLDYAVWLSINDLAQPWLESVQAGAWDAPGREKQLEFGLKAVEPRLASAAVAKLLGDKSLPRDGSGPWIEIIGQAGGPAELGKLFNQVVQNQFTDPAAGRALQALNEAARLRNARPGGDLNSLAQLIPAKSAEVAGGAVELIGRWKLSRFAPEVLKVAADGQQPAKLRQTAVQTLGLLSDPSIVPGLIELADRPGDESVRRQALLVAAQMDLARASKSVAQAFAAVKTEEEAVTIWRSLLSSKARINRLGVGAYVAKNILPKSGLPETVARAGMRVAREAGRNEPELISALELASSLSPETAGPSEAELQQLARDAVKSGDARRGEFIYRRPELACLTCHAIGGAGGKVGPDLVSLGASAQPDYIVESIFYPNRKVKEGYHSVVVQTRDDQEVSGILVRESAEEIVVRDVSNREVSIAKNKVQSRNVGGSLMPSGLIDALPVQERLDLIAFLSSLGKPGQFDASKPTVARTWKVRPGTHTVEQFGEEKIGDDWSSKEWSPVLSRVDGGVGPEDVRNAITMTNPNKFTGIVAVYAAAQFESARDGEHALQVDAPKGAQVWIDGRPVAGLGEIRTPLSKGRHTLVLKFDPRSLAGEFRVKSADVSFLTN